MTPPATSTTLPVFGHLIIDPVETVSKIDNVFAVVLGAFTFMTATIGINIVANFVSPAFDFSNVAPRHISWRMGGMIAAVGSIFITPWNLYNNPQVVHSTLDILGAFIGPLFGILIADFFYIKKEKVIVDDLYTMSPKGAYWYDGGYNKAAVYSVIPAALLAATPVVIPALHVLANFSWFIGCGFGFVLYMALMTRQAALAPQPA